jgi:hypothetical protein
MKKTRDDYVAKHIINPGSKEMKDLESLNQELSHAIEYDFKLFLKKQREDLAQKLTPNEHNDRVTEYLNKQIADIESILSILDKSSGGKRNKSKRRRSLRKKSFLF